MEGMQKVEGEAVVEPPEEVPTEEQMRARQHQERRRHLVRELKSGRWPQTTGKLRSPGEGYCCLGVACEVAIDDGLNISRWRAGTKIVYGSQGNNSATRLTNTVCDWYGFYDSTVHLRVPLLVAQEYPNLMVEWAETKVWTAVQLNDEFKLSLPEIGTCFQYTFLREEWEAQYGDTTP